MNQYTTKQLRRLFLQQSYEDAWNEYERQIHSNRAICWDYVVLTASNEEQALIFTEEINYRLDLKRLPSRTTYLVLPDPDGKRVGSGGATLNVLKEIAKIETPGPKLFSDRRILVIHSGGDSKRVPQYSACGKLFSPVPRSLPNGDSSTLFDEFMIATALIPGRLKEGMLVMAGDVLLLFNALQIDAQTHGAAAISIKADAEVGKDHGVYLGDEQDNVRRFLHKQSVDSLCACGAVNEQGRVNIDTGCVLLDCCMLRSLYSLISTAGAVDPEKFSRFVNERARISFYGDFQYPLGREATLEGFLKEAPEGEFCPELEECRKEIWEVLHKYDLKLIKLSPAEFIHFGTTKELKEMVTEAVEDYAFLGWSRYVSTNVNRADETTVIGQRVALHNVFLEEEIGIGDDCYLEHTRVKKGGRIGEGSIVSGLNLPENTEIPAHTVFHGLKLLDGCFVVRVYGVEDNPKDSLEKGGQFMGIALEELVGKVKKAFSINRKEAIDFLWKDRPHDVWNAKLFPSCNSVEEAIGYGKMMCRLIREESREDALFAGILNQWRESERYSLCSSFNRADGRAIIPWKENLEDSVRVDHFMDLMLAEVPVEEALTSFSGKIRKSEIRLLEAEAAAAPFSKAIRIWYGLARAAAAGLGSFPNDAEETYMQRCFRSIQKEVSATEAVSKEKEGSKTRHIEKDSVEVRLPVRVNWGGGWTDTPPYCMEHGGMVLNAAVTLEGRLPILVQVRRLAGYVVELESQDVGVHHIFSSMHEINDCGNPYDQFALHKAALIACGIIRRGDTRNLETRLRELGGGIYLSTQVIGVPKGSGLGTSSILSAACVRALKTFLGEEASDDAIYEVVLNMEQLMSTGGGWQDQVGGVVPGIKMITSKPGTEQKLDVEVLRIPDEALKELEDRFALIYTGQRRLARNLLRDVIGNYIGNRKDSIGALSEMKELTGRMCKALKAGDVDRFAKLLNLHWEQSVRLDDGTTNTCIDQILLAVEDMIDARFICGAGGGGFLQVILKKGITREQLSARLEEVFQDSGVEVWKAGFYTAETT